MHNVISRNNVRVLGKGKKVLIFGHGFGSDQLMWKYIVPAFEQDYKVVLFDHVGAGKSDKHAYIKEKYATLNGYAQDLLEICETLGIKGAIFVGHSVSAMIGILASIQQPAYFERMILIGPSPRYLNDPPHYHGGFEISDINDLLEMMEMNFVGWASYLAPIAMGNPDLPHLAEGLEETFQESDPAISKNFLEVTLFSDHREDLQHVTIPTLILQCSEDSFVPIEVGEYLHNHIPDSELQILNIKGHYPHLSDPNTTIDVIQRYLQMPLQSHS